MFQAKNQKKEAGATAISLVKWLASLAFPDPQSFLSPNPDARLVLVEAFDGLNLGFTGTDLVDAVQLFHLPRNVNSPPYPAGSAHAPISDAEIITALDTCGNMFNPREQELLLKLVHCQV